MTGYDSPELAVGAHRDRVVAKILERLAALLGEPVAPRLHRSRLTQCLPELEEVAALLWELGKIEAAPDVTLADRLRQVGLLERTLPYDVAIEAEDAADPVWWLEAAARVGEIPEGLRGVWYREDHPDIGMVGGCADDAEEDAEAGAEAGWHDLSAE